MITTSGCTIARQFMGIREVRGNIDNPQIMAMLKLDANWPKHDEVPYCSAFVNYVCFLGGLERTYSLRARSWLKVGEVISLHQAVPEEEDIVILKRGGTNEPGPDVIEAPGHVGFYVGILGGRIMVLGGNQNDEVNISSYSQDRLLGVRRLRQVVKPIGLNA